MTYYPIKSYSQVSKSDRYDYLEIGCTPSNEDCTQVGKGQEDHNKLECSVYINQLIRKYGVPPDDCSYFVMRNEHEAGNYYEAAIRFDNQNEKAMDYAFSVESGCDNWDNESLNELKSNNYILLSKLKRA